MLAPKPHLEPSEQPLPLFRPEVSAAQHQKAYGEVLRIRPLSAGVLVWLGMVLAGLLLAMLMLIGKPP